MSSAIVIDGIQLGESRACVVAFVRPSSASRNATADATSHGRGLRASDMNHQYKTPRCSQHADGLPPNESTSLRLFPPVCRSTLPVPSSLLIHPPQTLAMLLVSTKYTFKRNILDMHGHVIRACIQLLYRILGLSKMVSLADHKCTDAEETTSLVRCRLALRRESAAL